MTQRTPVKWIVPVPDNDPFGRKTFATACRGNADIGSVLNYFIYEASRQVERDGTDHTAVEYITLENRLHEAILERVDVSKKTLIAHIKKLEEWKHLEADAYHHRYKVCHKNVAKDILNPPEEIKPKIRGIHVAKCKFTLSTMPEELTLEVFQQMWQQMVNQQSEIVNLHTTIVDLQNQIVALHFVQSSEGTSQQGSTPIFDGCNSNNSSQEKEENRGVAAFADNPFTSSSQPASTSYSQFGYNQNDSSQTDMFSSERGTIPHPSDALEDSGETRVNGYEKGEEAHGNMATVDHRNLIGNQHDQSDQDSGHPGSPVGIRAQALMQQTPFTQVSQPVLSGDTQEVSGDSPPAVPLVLSHMPYADLDVFAEDTWVVIPGRVTEVPQEQTTEAKQGKKTRVPRQKQTETPAKPEPTPDELAFKVRTSALQSRINEWRGYALVDKGPLINERKRIQDLAREYSDETIEHIRLYLFNRHWKWSKPDNRYKIGAQILWEEAKSVMQILKEEERPSDGKPSASLGGMYRNVSSELAAERAKWMNEPPGSYSSRTAVAYVSSRYAR